jgi:peptidoglycan-associated lipoprotein
VPVPVDGCIHMPDHPNRQYRRTTTPAPSWHILVPLLLVCSLDISGCSGAETKGQGATAPQAAAVGRSSPAWIKTPDLAPHSIYFDYDTSQIKPKAVSVIDGWSQILLAHPKYRLRLEGNADERGTEEYDIALGERRDNTVAFALQQRGISADRLMQVSYGKERPVALGHDEPSWAQNRRVDIILER